MGKKHRSFHSLSRKLHKKRDCNDHKEVQNNQLVKLLSDVRLPTLKINRVHVSSLRSVHA